MGVEFVGEVRGASTFPHPTYPCGAKPPVLAVAASQAISILIALFRHRLPVVQCCLSWCLYMMNGPGPACPSTSHLWTGPGQLLTPPMAPVQRHSLAGQDRAGQTGPSRARPGPFAMSRAPVRQHYATVGLYLQWAMNALMAHCLLLPAQGAVHQ